MSKRQFKWGDSTRVYLAAAMILKLTFCVGRKQGVVESKQATNHQQQQQQTSKHKQHCRLSHSIFQWLTIADLERQNTQVFSSPDLLLHKCQLSPALHSKGKLLMCRVVGEKKKWNEGSMDFLVDRTWKASFHQEINKVHSKLLHGSIEKPLGISKAD